MGINGGAIEPEAPVAMTATQDIVAAAADELARGDFRGTSVRELLGPRDYTLSETTRILGEKIGKPDLIGIATLETFLQESQFFIGEP
jgi:uncharacterized protein YbjT (DUF2867 family)